MTLIHSSRTERHSRGRYAHAPAVYRPPTWLPAAQQALSAAVSKLGSRFRLSPVKPDRPEWELKTDTELIVTLSAARPNGIGVVAARDRGVTLALPERVKGRLVSPEAAPDALANSLLTLFIQPLKTQPAAAPKAVAAALANASPSADVQRVLTAAATPKQRPEIEADPFLKASSGFFRDGFLAYCDDEGDTCPWTLDTVRRIDWQLGYDYARLSCSCCGAKNTQGARCAMPQSPEDPEPTELPLYERMREAIGRLYDTRELPNAQQVSDAALLREAADMLERLMPRPAPDEKPVPPAICLRCVRAKESAKATLCLNAGLALARLRDIDEDVTAPYISVRLYGLRQKGKKDYWAYVVVTNGTLSQCDDPEIRVYREQAFPIDRSVLGQPLVPLPKRRYG